MGVPWFKLYALDYLGDPEVRMLSDADRGILVDCWAIQTALGGVPKDPELLGKLLKKRSDHAIKAFLRVSCFFVDDPLRDGFMISLRLASELALYEHKVLANQTNGLKGGRPKKNPLGLGLGGDYGNPNITEPEPEPEKDKDVKPPAEVPTTKRLKKASQVKAPKDTFEEILGTGTLLDMSKDFWELSRIWPEGSNIKKKDSARAYVEARKEASHECIFAWAEWTLKETQGKITTLAAWLSNQDWQGRQERYNIPAANG